MLNKINKILLCLCAFLLFAATAQADVICVRKRAGVKSGKVRLYKSVIRRKTCPKRFRALLDTDDLIKGKADISSLSSYLTKSELDSLLDKYATAGDLATLKALVGDNKMAIASVNEEIAKKADASALKDYAKSTDVDLALAAKVDTSSLADYAKTADVDTALAAKADSDALTDYAKTADVDTALAAKADASALTDYAKSADVDAALAAKADSDALTDYAKSADVDAALLAKADASALASYASKDDLSNLEETISYELENKAGKVSEPGETITGVVGGTSKFTVVSLPTAAPQPIDYAAIGNAEECTGDALNPTAPAGKLCVYFFGSHADKQFVVEPLALPCASPEQCSEPVCVVNDNSGNKIFDEDKCIAFGGEWDANFARCVTDTANCAEENKPVCKMVQKYTGGLWDCVCAEGTVREETRCMNNAFGCKVLCDSLSDLDLVELIPGFSGYSKQGFVINSSARKFEAVWAYTAPEAE